MSINREILSLAIPSILASITVPLVGMVDIAVAGHITANEIFTAAAFIGAIAVGSTLFDLLYVNFGFLRAGTGGLTAQAYGRGDMRECANVLYRAMGVALAAALFLIAIQWLFVTAAFAMMKCSPEVRSLASTYFYIRIWAAPATLSLMSLRGWFIGMQNTVASMAVDLVVNGVNILSSIVLTVGIPGVWAGLGFKGIALGTVIAQYSGLLTALGILSIKYRKVLAETSKASIRASFSGPQMRRFFSMNTDLFVRSLCFIGIYVGFTVIAARYGDVLLAMSSIMMKLLMLFSYFTDGFAYAGEAMTGKYIGAQEPQMVRKTVLWVFIWSLGIAVLFMGIYGFGGGWLVRLMTSDSEVAAVCRRFMPWLLLMPPFGCAAFAWDGIYLGATASKPIRNAMIAAAVSFFAVWFAGIGLLQISNGHGDYASMAMHILMAAYFAHLLARTLWLSAGYRKLQLS